MNFTRTEVVAAGGDGDNLLGRGLCWPNGSEAGAEESLGRFGCGGEDPEEALGDNPTWMLRWQAAIFGDAAFRQAGGLWWLPGTRRSRGLRVGGVQVFPAMEGGIEQAQIPAYEKQSSARAYAPGRSRGMLGHVGTLVPRLTVCPRVKRPMVARTRSGQGPTEVRRAARQVLCFHGALSVSIDLFRLRSKRPQVQIPPHKPLGSFPKS